MQKLTLVLIPPLVAKGAPLGKPIIATYDPNNSTIRDEDGSSLLPSIFPTLRNATEIPEDAFEILITEDNYQRLFEMLPKDISKNPFYLKGSERFPKEKYGHLTFMLYHQLISSVRTPLIPYFSYRVKQHLEKFTLGLESEYDWLQPIENTDDAITFAFFLLAVQIVTGRIVIMICDPELGPPKLPPQLNPVVRSQIKWSPDDFDITKKVIEPPKPKLILPPNTGLLN